jgi:hypothetical protein
MKLSSKIGLGLLAIIILIQFIRSPKNISEPLITNDDISKTVAIPEGVHQILIKKCYDCHSNNTLYPWYYNIQPIAMWMADHIEEGKEELNFSAFRTYTAKRANHKLEELHDAVTEGWMPIDSYIWMHHDAKIEPQEVEAINNWLKSLGVEFDKEEEHEH